MVMDDRIGSLAGKVYRLLDDGGEHSLNQVCKAVNAPRSKVNMAIGWLAREDKLEFVEKSRGTAVRLKQS
jgi:hypothetical protein